MASLIRRGGKRNARLEVSYYLPNGDRGTVRLGRIPYEVGQQITMRVERLLAARRLNVEPDAETVAWLRGLDSKVHERIAAKGLVKPREAEPGRQGIGEFTRRILDTKRRKKKARTCDLYERSRRYLLEFFAERTALEDIRPDRAAEWQEFLHRKGMSEATVRSHTRDAKMYFNAAVDAELIHRNPFAKLPSGSVASKRDVYVTPQEAILVLQACPSDQWRALFGLARYAGLRLPSETHILEFGHIDWHTHRMNVYAPKTDSTRQVPIEPRLQRLLLAVFVNAGAGQKRVIRLPRNNLHRRFRRIVKAAGLTPWAAPFQSLRQSCETEWAGRYPQYAVS